MQTKLCLWAADHQSGQSHEIDTAPVVSSANESTLRAQAIECYGIENYFQSHRSLDTLGVWRYLMSRIGSAAAVFVAATQLITIGGLPARGAQNCGADAHWVQTGSALGAGYCKPKHRRDHQVCAIGYHYEGRGRCRRNGPWWTGRRPINWGPYYEPREASGGVTFEVPNGGKIKVKW